MRRRFFGVISAGIPAQPFPFDSHVRSRLSFPVFHVISIRAMP